MHMYSMWAFKEDLEQHIEALAPKLNFHSQPRISSHARLRAPSLLGGTLADARVTRATHAVFGARSRLHCVCFSSNSRGLGTTSVVLRIRLGFPLHECDTSALPDGTTITGSELRSKVALFYAHSHDESHISCSVNFCCILLAQNNHTMGGV